MCYVIAVTVHLVPPRPVHCVVTYAVEGCPAGYSAKKDCGAGFDLAVNKTGECQPREGTTRLGNTQCERSIAFCSWHVQRSASGRSAQTV